jgi:hypothetical protein
MAQYLRKLIFLPLVLAGCFNASPTVIPDAGTPDATADWVYCSGFGSCALQPAGCCAVCGMPTANDVDAVRMGTAPTADHRNDVCPMPPSACPACATGENPALYALCLASRCTVLDVRTQPLSACTQNADCALVPHDCCGCGGSYTAVHKDAVDAFHDTVCDTTDACVPCSTPPVGIEAFCAPDMHCDVRPVP